MTEIYFPPFRKEQAQGRYPFADGALLTTDTGFTVRDEIFLDAVLYPLGMTSRVSLQAVVVTYSLITLQIGSLEAGLLCSGEFDPAEPPEVIALTDANGRSAGVLVADPDFLLELTVWAVGTHTFAAGAAEFVATVCLPRPDVGVRALGAVDADLLVDDVWLVGDDGVVLTEVDGNIRIDIVGDPLFRRRLCTPAELFVTPLMLQSINHIGPDEFGNWSFILGDHLAADSALRIFVQNGELHFEVIGS